MNKTSNSHMRLVVWSISSMCGSSKIKIKTEMRIIEANLAKGTFVKMPTPHSMATLARNKSSASNLSLNPPKFSSHRNTADFSSSNNLFTIEPGTRPASTAAAKSAGNFSSGLPASARTSSASSRFRSLSSDSPSPPPPPPPACPPPVPPPGADAKMGVVGERRGVKRLEEECLGRRDERVKEGSGREERWQ